MQVTFTGIWFYGGTRRLHIIDGHSPLSSNDECTTPLQLPALQTTRVRLFMTTTQTRVYFNDTLVCSEGRTDRVIYPNAKVYASNPWYTAANAWISGFYLQPLRVVRGYQQHTFFGSQPQQLARVRTLLLWVSVHSNQTCTPMKCQRV